MIALKDSIIAQTANLAEAIETLELAADLDHQVQQAVAAFGKMRHALVEILAFEPGIQRALVILEPLTALGNLRHISGAELRDVARLVRDQHKAMAERPPPRKRRPREPPDRRRPRRSRGHPRARNPEARHPPGRKISSPAGAGPGRSPESGFAL